MPQPRKPATPKAPPVRGDATQEPAPAVAPGKSVAGAVAKRAPAAKAGGAKAKDAPAAKAAAATAKGKAKVAAQRKPAAAKDELATPKRKPAAAKDELATPKRPAARPKAAPAGQAKSPAPEAPARPKPKSKRAAPKAKATRPAVEPAPAPEPTSAAARDEALRANLASLRDLLAGGVVLTTQRLQEAVDEAVTRGRITRRDAEDLATGLLAAGRQQTQDLLADLEQIVGRGKADLATARSITKATVKGSERVLREVDRARRAAGIGTSFPILGYDDLSAAQVTKRLGELSPAELRKVRDHERRGAARKTVLAAVEEALA